jgi:hypothetical protein
MTIQEYLASLSPSELQAMKQISQMAIYLAETKSDPDKLNDCILFLRPALEAMGVQETPAQIPASRDWNFVQHVVRKL